MLLTLLIGLAISHAPGRSTFLQNGTRTVLKCQVYYHGIPWLLVMFDLEWGKRTYHRIKMWPCERVQNSLNKNYWLGKVKVSSHWQYCTASAGNDWTRKKSHGVMSDSPLFRKKKNIKNRQISILLELCHWHKGGHFGILLQSLAGWGVHISFRHYMRERESPTDSTHILLPCGYRGMGWWQRRQAFPTGCLFDFAQKVIEHVTSTSGQDCRKTNRVVQVTWETNVSLCVCVYACVSSHFSCFPSIFMHLSSFLSPLSFATYCLPMQISGFI